MQQRLAGQSSIEGYLVDWGSVQSEPDPHGPRGTLHVTSPSGVTRTTRPPGLRPPQPPPSPPDPDTDPAPC